MKAASDAISLFSTAIIHFDRFLCLERTKLDPFFTEGISDLLRHPQRAERPRSYDEQIGAAFENPLEIDDLQEMPLFADPGREELVLKEDQITHHRLSPNHYPAEAVRRQRKHKVV